MLKATFQNSNKCTIFPKALLFVLENIKLSSSRWFSSVALGSPCFGVLVLPISPTLFHPIFVFLYTLLTCLVMALAFIYNTCLLRDHSVLHAFHPVWLLEVSIWGSLYPGSNVLLLELCQGLWIQNTIWLQCYLELVKARMHTGLCPGSGGLRVIGRQRGDICQSLPKVSGFIGRNCCLQLMI